MAERVTPEPDSPDELRYVCDLIDHHQRVLAELYGARRLIMAALRSRGWRHREVANMARISPRNRATVTREPEALLERLEVAERLLARMAARHGWPTDATTAEAVLLDYVTSR